MVFAHTKSVLRLRSDRGCLPLAMMWILIAYTTASTPKSSASMNVGMNVGAKTLMPTLRGICRGCIRFQYTGYFVTYW